MARRPPCTDDRTPAQRTADKYVKQQKAAKPEPLKRGRPTDYNEGVAAEICERLALGRSLVAICRDDDDMPAMRTIFTWLSKHESFAQNYTRARELQADTIFDETLDIADSPMVGEKVITEQAPPTIDPDTGDVIREGGVITKTTRSDMIEHRKLRIDTRKWIAAQLRPKKYGPKVQAEITGPDGGPMRTINMEPEEYLQIAQKVIKEF